MEGEKGGMVAVRNVPMQKCGQWRGGVCLGGWG